MPHSTTGDLSDLSTVYFIYKRFKPQCTGFRGILPRHWIVEHSFSWLSQSRRMSKDYECVCHQTSETWIYILTLRRA